MSKYITCHPSYQQDDLILEAVEAAKGLDGLADANLYFLSLCDRNPEFIQVSNNVYHYGDYYINVGKRFLMAGHGQCLMNLTRMELSCLPQGVALIWLDNGEDMVLITKIPGCAGRRLIPYGNHPHKTDFQARRQLLADVDRLLEENYAVLAVTENKNAWYMLEEDERIILAHCQLATVSNEAKPAYRNRVLKMLDLHE